MKLTLLGTTALLAISIAATNPASAQTTTPQPPADPPVVSEQVEATADSAEGLADIIVTAQRRSETLQNAAVAISAATSETLVNAGVTDVTQLTSVIPSLQIGNATGPFNAFYLRGVGNFTTNALADSAVAFGVDGVYFARVSAAGGVFYDLERVEVLKGPQGTLYGRNATGGAINVITAKPRQGEFSGYVTGEYANYDSKKLTGAVNIPMGENGALRVAGQLVDRDGFFSDGTSDERTEALRVQMSSQLTDTLSVIVGGDFYHAGGRGGGATLSVFDLNDRIGLSDPRSVARYQATTSPGAGNRLPGLDGSEFQNNKFYGAYMQVDLETALGTLTVLPAFRVSELDYRTNTNGSFANVDETDEQFSVEARLASDDARPLRYLVGAYYLNDTSDVNAQFNQFFFASHVNFRPTTDSYAAFGRLTWALTDRFRLTGGARYTEDHKQADIVSRNLIVACPSQVPPRCQGGPTLPNSIAVPAFAFGPTGALIPNQPFGTTGNRLITSQVSVSPSRTFDKVTWRGAAEFDLAERSLLYASVETGFKSGGFFSSVDAASYDPETITAYTIGSKNRFLDNRLQLNLEGFYWKYKGQQFSHFRSNSIGGQEFATENIGSSTVKGFEIDGRFLVTRSTLFTANVQYLDSIYDSFVYRNPIGSGRPLTGCAVAQDTTSFIVDCSGKRPPQSPEWTLAFSGEQTIDLGSTGKLVAIGRTRYQTRSLTAPDFLPNQEQAAYWMSDAQLTFTTADDRFTITGFVNNIENNDIVAFSQIVPQSGNSLFTYSLRPPRTYGVRVGTKF